MLITKKLRAIKLRKLGKSYSEIQKTLSVSKSTLSCWLKDIALSKEQKARLSKLQATGYIGAKTNQINALHRRNKIKEFAEKEGTILAKNPFFVAGLMLYWAEGTKNLGSVQFSNSDPAMIKMMMCWFRKFCHVPENKFKIGLFIHSLHSRKGCLNFWNKVTSVPLPQFYRPHVKSTIFSNRKNKLYDGTCRIIIHNRDLLNKIIGWKSGVEKTFLSTN
jgi:hypothetical protein